MGITLVSVGISCLVAIALRAIYLRLVLASRCELRVPLLALACFSCTIYFLGMLKQLFQLSIFFLLCCFSLSFLFLFSFFFYFLLHPISFVCESGNTNVLKRNIQTGRSISESYGQVIIVLLVFSYSLRNKLQKLIRDGAAFSK